MMHSFTPDFCGCNFTSIQNAPNVSKKKHGNVSLGIFGKGNCTFFEKKNHLFKKSLNFHDTQKMGKIKKNIRIYYDNTTI